MKLHYVPPSARNLTAGSCLALCAAVALAQSTPPAKGDTGKPGVQAGTSATANPSAVPTTTPGPVSGADSRGISIKIGPCPRYDKAGKLIEPCPTPVKANAAAGK